MPPNNRRGRSSSPNHLRDVSLDTDEATQTTLAGRQTRATYDEDAPFGITGRVAVKVSPDEYLRMKEAAAAAASDPIELDDIGAAFDTAPANPADEADVAVSAPTQEEDETSGRETAWAAGPSVEERLDQVFERFAQSGATTPGQTTSSGRLGSAAVSVGSARRGDVTSPRPKRQASPRRLLLAAGAVALVTVAIIAVIVGNGHSSRPPHAVIAAHRSAGQSQWAHEFTSIVQASTRVGTNLGAKLKQERRVQSEIDQAQRQRKAAIRTARRLRQAATRRAAQRARAAKSAAASPTTPSTSSPSAPTDAAPTSTGTAPADSLTANTASSINSSGQSSSGSGASPEPAGPIAGSAHATGCDPQCSQ
jgi:hypothetical protein